MFVHFPNCKKDSKQHIFSRHKSAAKNRAQISKLKALETQALLFVIFSFAGYLL